MKTFEFDFWLKDWQHWRAVRGPACSCWTFLLGPLWITWHRDGHWC
jgi:hypothetical protein